MAWHPFRNVGLKIFATALGTLLWFMVSGRQVERPVAVPLSFSNVPAELVLTGERIDTVRVQVRGNDSEVSRLGPEDVRVIVDLGDAHPGPNLIPLRVDEVIAPLGVDVLQLDPGAVTVTLERSGRIDVPVEPTVEGRPAPGFVVRSIVSHPATVAVVGPESRLKEPISVITERVLIDGSRRTVSQDVSVGVADAQLRLAEPRTVRVTVTIEPERSGR
jgi:YbbR domain-containing protein